MSTDPVRAKLPGLALGAAVLFAALAAAVKPAPALSVSEWADAHRVVSAESGSPNPGRWSTDLVPYLREPMDCLHPDHPARRVTVRASAQVGKSEIHVNWFGYIVDRAPGTALFVLPSLDEAVKFNRTKLQPAIDSSPAIRHRVRPENARDEAASTTSFKRFSGGFAQIVTASSSKGLQAISIRYLGLDEVSEYPHDVDGRGDPIDQARARQLAYGDRGKELATSTPGLGGACRISAMYEAGDQRRYYVECPHCRDFSRLEFENMVFDQASGRAKFACAGCGALADDLDKAQMVARGRWIPTFTEDGAPKIPAVIPASEIDRYTCPPCEGRCRDRQPSYHIWAAYSPFLSWTEIWRRWTEARENPLKRKPFDQQILGIPHDAAGEAPPFEKLLERVEEITAGVVPREAPVLVGSADVQKDRIEWNAWAWGPRGQGWLVDRGICHGSPAEPAVWRDLAEVVERRFATADGGAIGFDLFGVDSGYLSPLVYEFVRGRGRVLALDGRPGENVPPLATPKRIVTKAANGAPLGAIMLHPVGTHGLKTTIHQGLKALIQGPDETGRWPGGTLHFPRGLVDEDYFRQITAESLVMREKRDGRVAFEWVVGSYRRNEALDLAVYARALAWRLGIDRMSEAQWRALAAERAAPLPEQSDMFEPALAATPAPAGAAPAPARRDRAGWLSLRRDV